MDKTSFKSDIILLTTAVIWGFAFVAQRVGMDHVGPFIFNGVRFALGCLVLLPFIIMKGTGQSQSPGMGGTENGRFLATGGFLAGLALFAGSSFQQVGIVYTTAGKAGFITGLYVVIVPVLALFFRKKTNRGTWLGAFLAAAGLYLLSVTEQFTIDFGDFLVLIGSACFAAHVLVIGWLSPRVDSLKLAVIQYAVVSFLSTGISVVFEDTTLQGLSGAATAILYGGAMSVGIAYTLQVIGQRKAHPAHASILLSMESVFAALGGWMLLQETMNLRQFMGCALMFSAMLVSQLWGFFLVRAGKR